MTSSIWLFVPLALPVIYMMFLLNQQPPAEIIVTDRTEPTMKQVLKFALPLQKQIPCGLLLAEQSEQVHPLEKVLVDSTAEISTMTPKALEEYGSFLAQMIETPGNMIPAGSLWLRMDEATVAAPAIKVVQDTSEEYSLKLGMDFLKAQQATYQDEELFIRVKGRDDPILIPFIMPRRSLPVFDAATDVQQEEPLRPGGANQLVIREQIPCGLILESSPSEVHPLKTSIDSSVAISTISRAAAEQHGVLKLASKDILPEGAFSLRMDEATVQSPTLRIVNDDTMEYALTLGKFFLNEHGAQMKDGDLYIEANGQEQVLIPFIRERATLSFGDPEL